MNISTDAEKAFDTIQHPLIDKNLEEARNTKNVPQHNKDYT
jgi:hypothetical protein